LLEAGTNATGVAFLPDQYHAIVGYEHGEVKVWDWGKPGAPRPLLTFPGSDWSWVFRRHGERIAIGRFDQRVVADFDLRSWTEVDRWEAPGTLWSLAFTPDDRLCVMGGYRGQINVYDRIARRSFSPVPIVPNGAAVLASPDGAAVAIANEQGYGELWGLPDWKRLARFGGFLHPVGDLAFSQDGLRLAVGSSGAEAVRLFELRQFQALITLTGRGSLFAPRFSPTGDCLAALNASGEIWVWPAPSWAEITAREAQLQAGH
jgi:WD40 repeat protein